MGMFGAHGRGEKKVHFLDRFIFSRYLAYKISPIFRLEYYVYEMLSVARKCIGERAW